MERVQRKVKETRQPLSVRNIEVERRFEVERLLLRTERQQFDALLAVDASICDDVTRLRHARTLPSDDLAVTDVPPRSEIHARRQARRTS